MTSFLLPSPEVILSGLDQDGYAILPGLFNEGQCTMLAASYDDDTVAFRSRVIMSRHGYGQGEYQYFARPMPLLVQSLRELAYPLLAEVANIWSDRLIGFRRWPTSHSALTAECAAAGQTKPTALLLKYGRGDHNRLHQDIYGELVFPLQLVVLLDQPGEDFAGGEFVLVEGRARMQSRAKIVHLRRGDAVVFPVRERPVHGARGWSRAMMRHGVADVIRGVRRTLGIIFHDAK